MHGENLIDISTFLMALLVLIVAAKIGAEIFERFGQPSVLGEIIAGVLIGATGFGLVTRGLAGSVPVFHVFGLGGQSGQATYEALDALAEIGVIILLFEIGLHSDLYELGKVGKSALWVGAAGVVLPFAGGWWLCSHMFGLSTFTSLFVGAALTATSVGITARVFRDLDLLHTAESKVVLGAAVADDVIGLVILAVISGLGAAGAQAENLWLKALGVSAMAIGFLAGSLIIGVKCVPLLEKVFYHTKSRGSTTVLAFAFCLFIALLSKEVGLAAIVGAFAAGLVLSHCECREEIQEGIKPLADLFVPLFFAMMGTVVNLREMAGGGVLAMASALIAVAIVGKVIGCATVPDKKLNRLTIGLAMIPRGEVGLIFARLGIQHGWVSGAMYDALILMVLVTTLITPPLLRWAGLNLKKSRGEEFDNQRAPHDLARKDCETVEVNEMLQASRNTEFKGEASTPSPRDGPPLQRPKEPSLEILT